MKWLDYMYWRNEIARAEPHQRPGEPLRPFGLARMKQLEGKHHGHMAAVSAPPVVVPPVHPGKGAQKAVHDDRLAASVDQAPPEVEAQDHARGA